MRLRVLMVLLLMGGAARAGSAPAEHWVGSWACSQQLADPANRPPVADLTGWTLRQFVQVSLGGTRIRLRLSNRFGDTEVTLAAVHLAAAAGRGAIDPATDRAVTFSGSPAATLARGATLVSDPLDFTLAPGADLAITLRFARAPHDLTAHPGSRTTSFLARGADVSLAQLPDPASIDHWYFIAGLDVLATGPADGALVVLGDSLTDGRGSTTNGNDRWTDRLAHRLQTARGPARVGVLNQGLGGNRLLRDGVGPSGVSRFGRDVLAGPGVRWLVLFEGINDLGTAVADRQRGEPAATPQDIIQAYAQCIERAHAHGIRVYGVTLMPFEGFSSYDRARSEAERQTINRWIRGSGRFDAVIDFDAAIRDARRPSRLDPAYDGSDHLHLNPAGYDRLAQAVDLTLFRD